MILLAVGLAHESALTVLLEHFSEHILAFLVKTAIGLANADFLNNALAFCHQINPGQAEGVDDASVLPGVKLFLVDQQPHLMGVCVEVAGDVCPQLVKRQTGRNIQEGTRLVYVEVVDQTQHQSLGQEKGSQGRSLVHSILLRFVQKPLNYPQVFFSGLRNCGVELSEAAFEEGGPEDGNAVGEVGGEVVEEEADEL